MSYPMILSDNLFDNAGTLSASDTDSAYSINNIIDLRTYTYWKAANATTGTKYVQIALTAGATANAVGIIGHNFYTAGVITLKLQHSADGATWTDMVTFTTPANDKAIFKTFTAPAAKGYWRLHMADDGGGYDAAPQLAVLMVGTRIDFPTTPETAFDPGKETAAVSLSSKGGHLLGAVYSYTRIRITATFKEMTRTFVWDTLYAWWTAYGKLLKPFFWVWDYTNYATDIRFVKLTDGMSFDRPLSRADYVDSVTLEMEGVIEE